MLLEDHLKKKYYALKEENQDLKVQLNLVQSADSVGSGQQQPHGLLHGQPHGHFHDGPCHSVCES